MLCVVNCSFGRDSGQSGSHLQVAADCGQGEEVELLKYEAELFLLEGEVRGGVCRGEDFALAWRQVACSESEKGGFTTSGGASQDGDGGGEAVAEFLEYLLTTFWVTVGDVEEFDLSLQAGSSGLV